MAPEHERGFARRARTSCRESVVLGQILAARRHGLERRTPPARRPHRRAPPRAQARCARVRRSRALIGASSKRTHFRPRAGRGARMCLGCVSEVALGVAASAAAPPFSDPGDPIHHEKSSPFHLGPGPVHPRPGGAAPSGRRPARGGLAPALGAAARGGPGPGVRPDDGPGPVRPGGARVPEGGRARAGRRGAAADLLHGARPRADQHRQAGRRGDRRALAVRRARREELGRAGRPDGPQRHLLQPPVGDPQHRSVDQRHDRHGRRRHRRARGLGHRPPATRTSWSRSSTPASTCNHPDLAANIWTNPGEIAGQRRRRRRQRLRRRRARLGLRLATTAIPTDEDGHGTHLRRHRRRAWATTASAWPASTGSASWRRCASWGRRAASPRTRSRR